MRGRLARHPRDVAVRSATLTSVVHTELRRGLSSLTVRSNVVRELSHPFYESLGYSRRKTQHVYHKALASGGREHQEL